ncbi:MAG: hypothetical protein RML14_01530 [Meiothermus sp.]|uniref:hypothetical protein n=1 Tax=Meiothermus sp. TaxID=1955249 RepID=UPI00298F25BD|nr:hypothetical protein [Meiothermus sp.]MDW8480594.1 hypothetical protein [Meiothermus sp.]
MTPPKARTSKRGSHHLPEVALARGPVGGEGVTGDGSYLALFGAAWALVQHQGDKLLHLYQLQTQWVETGIVPIPHEGREIRHIALCFDQAARPVVAYERAGQVWVRQWEPVLSQYVLRGPFAGVDPVLIQDAEVNFYSPESDVLLFYLSPDRRTLHMRVQRELFANERTIETYPTERILDQGLALPYQWELLGEGITVRSDTYPVYLPTDLLTAMSAAGPQSGLYRPLVVVQDVGLDNLTTITGQAPATGNYRPLVVVQDVGLDNLTTITGQAPATGNYRPLVVVRDVGTDDLTTITGQAPATGTYAVKVVVVDLGPADVLTTITATPPATGNYAIP